MELLKDATFWTAISFLIFVVLIYVKGRQKITEAIDARIHDIRDEIEQSEKLRQEASDTLASAKKQAEKIEKQTKLMLENAHLEAKQLLEKAEKNMDDVLIYREQQLQERMNQEKQALLNNMRVKITDISIQVATQLLQDKLSQQDVSHHIDSFLKDFERQESKH